jgi:hypothetical protein
MAFPSPAQFLAETPSRRYQAAKKAKRDAFRKEVDNLRLAQSARAPKPPEISPCSPEWKSFISSAGFKSWYEEVTCKCGDEYSKWLLTSDAHTLYRQTRDQWIARTIQNLLDDNRWQNPHYRRYWVKNISNCKGSKQRRAIIIRLATPKWANMVKVARFHRERAEISVRTGIPHDVDHIVPLQGRNVCGLNNEFNLCVIPATENQSKSNKYSID